ncbi:MAG: 23S rRNA (guanosine(2251)-2'-O)-methyltransferase RlmB [Nitrospirota bacterium]|nr:MAG: 23S rRNA (guanosine(2251)-2'-O)-methyltransferase RlmB [Nitrospirota bacterium]
MIIYGINPVSEVIGSEVKVNKVFVADRMDDRIRKVVDLAKKSGITVSRKGKEFFREQRGKNPQYIAADVEIKFTPFEELLGDSAQGETVLAMDLIEDPRNLGAVIRSAAACGVDGVVIQSRRSCGITSVVVSASAGTIARVRISEVPNVKNAIKELKNEGFRVIGTDSSGTDIYWDADLTGRTVIVMGSEGKGLRKTVKELCDLVVRIPMEKGISSLNVSVAAGVLLYEVMRQKNT